MASGFLVLPDGRCFSRRWSAHDAIVRAISDQITESAAGRELRDSLRALLPGPDDEEHLGYGPWLRKSDEQVVERFIDMRAFPSEDQKMVSEAIHRAASLAEDSQIDPALSDCLRDLDDMVTRMERGEPPLSRSDWREVVPLREEHSISSQKKGPIKALDPTRGSRPAAGKPPED